jgi:hypothetical protein
MAKKRFSRIQSKPHHDLKSRFWKGNNGRVFGFEIITLAILSHRNGGGCFFKEKTYINYITFIHR